MFFCLFVFRQNSLKGEGGSISNTYVKNKLHTDTKSRHRDYRRLKEMKET